MWCVVGEMEDGEKNVASLRSGSGVCEGKQKDMYCIFSLFSCCTKPVACLPALYISTLYNLYINGFPGSFSFFFLFYLPFFAPFHP